MKIQAVVKMGATGCPRLCDGFRRRRRQEPERRVYIRPARLHAESVRSRGSQRRSPMDGARRPRSGAKGQVEG